VSPHSGRAAPPTRLPPPEYAIR